MFTAKQQKQLEQYNQERQRVLQATENINVSVSLQQAAAILPRNPEWDFYCPRQYKRRRPRSERRSTHAD